MFTARQVMTSVFPSYSILPVKGHALQNLTSVPRFEPWCQWLKVERLPFPPDVMKPTLLAPSRYYATFYFTLKYAGAVLINFFTALFS